VKYFKNLIHFDFIENDLSISVVERRRISLLIILSVAAGFLLVSIGSYDLLIGEGILGIYSIGTALLLLLNLLHVRYYGKYNINIYFGLSVISVFFILIYWNGNTENISYIWYLAFPGFSAFALGSKRGGIAMVFMTLPLILAHFFGHHTALIADYDLDFEIRFLIAYFVMCYQAILFENVVERNQAEILGANVSLERTVEKRTADLADQIDLLAREIDERTLAEEKANRALAEKDVIFREMHHRTKNNMNVIISLLNLQKRELSVEHVEGVFQQIADRIRSMAIVHEQLYQSENVAVINLGDYIKNLIEHIKRSHISMTDEFILKIQQDDVLIGLEQAVPLGLALNEIITNVFKHGKPEAGSIKLDITLQLDVENKVHITIADMGTGFPANFELKESTSLGLHLVNILIEGQLDGKVSLNTGPGACYQIIVPLDDAQADI